MRSHYPSLDSAFSDAERVKILFSPFRSRALNPHHYEEKMTFWIQCIEEYTTCDKRVCFTARDLENAFVAENNQKTLCLGEVLNSLVRDGSGVRKDIFLKSLPNRADSTWLTWSLNQFRWATKKLWSLNPIYNSVDKDTPLVYIPQLQAQERRLLSIRALRDKIYSLEEWKSIIVKTIGFSEDVDLLVEYLRAMGKFSSSFVGQTEILKLCDERPSEITQVEKGQYDIRRTVQILEHDLETLYEKQKHAEDQARLALRAGKRNTAKCHLRARKMTEKRADKLATVLDNLTAISVQVEDATTDARILAAYESGKIILDKVLVENDLTTDRITDAMLNVQEVLEMQEEISSSLAQPLVDEDMSELESELELLLAEDKNVHQKNKEASARDGHESDHTSQQEKMLSKLDDMSLYQKPRFFPKPVLNYLNMEFYQHLVPRMILKVFL